MPTVCLLWNVCPQNSDPKRTLEGSEQGSVKAAPRKLPIGPSQELRERITDSKCQLGGLCFRKGTTGPWTGQRTPPPPAPIRPPLSCVSRRSRIGLLTPTHNRHGSCCKVILSHSSCKRDANFQDYKGLSDWPRKQANCFQMRKSSKVDSSFLMSANQCVCVFPPMHLPKTSIRKGIQL